MPGTDSIKHPNTCFQILTLLQVTKNLFYRIDPRRRLMWLPLL